LLSELIKRPKVMDKDTIEWIISEATKMAKEGKSRNEIANHIAYELDTSPFYIHKILYHCGWRIRDVKPKKKVEKKESSKKKRVQIDPAKVIELAKKYADEGLEKKEAMEKIAEELGVSPKSLYPYFKKYNLHALYPKTRKIKHKDAESQSVKAVKEQAEQVIKIPAKRKVKIIIVVE